MTIYIITDIKKYNWLSYIIEEFLRIEKAKFNIKICSKLEEIEDPKFALEYSEKNKSDFPWIKKQVSSKYDFIKLNEKYICEQTVHNENSSLFSFDIFWNIFLQMSRLEEFEFSQNGGSIQSYQARHPRNQKLSFSYPSVNILFNEFKNILKTNWPVNFEEISKPLIELSHDLDYISKTLPLRLKQTAFNGINIFRNIQKPSKSIYYLKRSFSFLFSNPSYWCFDYWREIETRYNQKSIFYVYSKTEGFGIKNWLLDPLYDISKNNQLQIELKKLIDKGFEIGLHGSFNSANSIELLKTEKEKLENALEINISKTRQHWLRYYESETPSIHEKLFNVDSTVGFNDSIGFRSGIASQYRPYNHKEERAYQYLITPQIIMDSNLFDYNVGDEEMILQKSFDLLDKLAKVNNAHVSISWHPRTCSPDYNWHNAYERILERYF